MNNEQEYHKSRIAFMIINDEIIFLEYSIMSNREWYESLSLKQENFKKIVRGYILENKAVFYKGEFKYDEEVIKTAKKFSAIKKDKYNIKNLEVWVGVKQGKIGEIWSPIKKIMNYKE